MTSPSPNPIPVFLDSLRRLQAHWTGSVLTATLGVGLSCARLGERSTPQSLCTPEAPPDPVPLRPQPFRVGPGPGRRLGLRTGLWLQEEELQGTWGLGSHTPLRKSHLCVHGCGGWHLSPWGAVPRQLSQVGFSRRSGTLSSEVVLELGEVTPWGDRSWSCG